MNREGWKFTSVLSLVPAANGRFQPKEVKGIAWSPKGNELFYRAGPQWKMMAVDIQTMPTFSAGKPRLLFETPQSA